MTVFEYLAVLFSIIIGLGITHLLGGIGRLIRRPERYKVYWVHLVWTFSTFLYLLLFWWMEFKMSSIEEWTLPIFLFLVLYAVLLYLLCVVLFPSEFPDDGDFRAYFYERHQWICGIGLALGAVDVVDTVLKGLDTLVGYLFPNPLFWILLIMLGIGFRTGNERFHGVLAVVWTLVLLVAMSFQSQNLLGS